MTGKCVCSGDLHDLVARAVDGDAVAFGGLVHRYDPLVRATARRCGAGADAEDLAQETWLRLMQHLGGLREPAALPAWLCRTVRNLCYSRGRRLHRVRFTPFEAEGAADSLPGDGGDPCADEVVGTAAAVVVRRAVSRLSDRDQRLARHVMFQTAYGDISRDLAMPLGSIGPTRERMLRRLGATREIRRLGDAA
jgi:RNA polymerase sigma factor (sigma-70 family)